MAFVLFGSLLCESLCTSTYLFDRNLTYVKKFSEHPQKIIFKNIMSLLTFYQSSIKVFGKCLSWNLWRKVNLISRMAYWKEQLPCDFSRKEKMICADCSEKCKIRKLFWFEMKYRWTKQDETVFLKPFSKPLSPLGHSFNLSSFLSLL